MQTQLKGMGVWLETFEIVDVYIKDDLLFKDMQANYREQRKRDAELIKMKTEAELQELRNTKALELKKLTDEISIKLEAFRQESNIKINGQVSKDTEAISKITNDINDANNNNQKERQKLQSETDLQVTEI